jgi:hypothetical protein
MEGDRAEAQKEVTAAKSAAKATCGMEDCKALSGFPCKWCDFEQMKATLNSGK